MSKPTAGTYAIVNRVLSGSGDKLAITLGDQGKLVATPYTDGDTQKWIIRDYNGTTQSVSPKNNPYAQVGIGPDGMTVLPPGNYVYIIRANDFGVTIATGDNASFWELKTAASGTPVTLGANTNNEKQNWILTKQ